jgi:hypothetical protein
MAVIFTLLTVNFAGCSLHPGDTLGVLPVGAVDLIELSEAVTAEIEFREGMEQVG